MAHDLKQPGSVHLSVCSLWRVALLRTISISDCCCCRVKGYLSSAADWSVLCTRQRSSCYLKEVNFTGYLLNVSDGVPVSLISATFLFILYIFICGYMKKEIKNRRATPAISPCFQSLCKIKLIATLVLA